MDGLDGTSRIDSRLTVNERKDGGRRGDAEAFRRALQGNAGDDGKPDAQPKPPPQLKKPTANPAMRTGLQPQGPDGRQQEQPRHIDVYA